MGVCKYLCEDKALGCIAPKRDSQFSALMKHQWMLGRLITQKQAPTVSPAGPADSREGGGVSYISVQAKLL